MARKVPGQGMAMEVVEGRQMLLLFPPSTPLRSSSDSWLACILYWFGIRPPRPMPHTCRVNQHMYEQLVAVGVPEEAPVAAPRPLQLEHQRTRLHSSDGSLQACTRNCFGTVQSVAMLHTGPVDLHKFVEAGAGSLEEEVRASMVVSCDDATK